MRGLAAIVRVASTNAAERIVGRSVLERVVRAALSAGAKPCIILGFEPPADELQRIPGVRWTREEPVAREWAGQEFLLIETDALYDPRLIRWVMDSSPEPGRARTVRLDGRPILSKVHIGERTSNVALSAPESVPRNWLAPVRSRGEREWAHEWLFSRLIKEDEGFMSRLVERPLSTTLTRLLWRFPVSPNAVTFVSFAVGLWGAWQLSWGSWGRQVEGAFLFWVHSVLDGCDGELARLKLQESRLGGLLDYWSDNVVHLAVLTAIGLGLHRMDGGARWIVLGMAAAAAAFVSRRLAPEKSLAARRNLVYLLILAALFGKIGWFLWAAAVTGGLFGLALLYARFTSR